MNPPLPEPKGATFAIPVLPYGAMAATFANYGSTNNVETATYYKDAGKTTPLVVLTFTYAGGGASDNDILTGIVAS